MIKMLSKKRFSDFVQNKYVDKTCNRFITYDSGLWIGCDNTTGNKWVEEFRTLEDCVKWLRYEY